MSDATRDRALLVALCSRLIKQRDAATERDERNQIDRELNALSQAVYVTESGELGARAAWFVGAVVQADYVYQVFAALEGMVA